MVFNASFNNISVMSWWSDLSKLVEEIAENHRPVACHRQYYIMFIGKKLLRAYVVLFYYVPNQNKVFLSLILSSTLRHEQDSNSQR